MITITIDYDQKSQKELEKVEEITEIIQEVLNEKEPVGKVELDGTIKLNVDKVEMTEEGIKVKGTYKELGEHIDEITGGETKGEKIEAPADNRFSEFDIVELGIFDIALCTAETQLSDIKKMDVMPADMVTKMRDRVVGLKREVADEKFNRD